MLGRQAPGGKLAGQKRAGRCQEEGVATELCRREGEVSKGPEGGPLDTPVASHTLVKETRVSLSGKNPLGVK